LINEVDIFFNADDFASSATLTIGSTATTINCIFDDAGMVQNIGGVDVITTEISALCKTEDVANATQGSTILIGLVTYYIIQNLPQIDGTTKLILSKDAS
jgi:hypothetical protein